MLINTRMQPHHPSSIEIRSPVVPSRCCYNPGGLLSNPGIISFSSTSTHIHVTFS